MRKKAIRGMKRRVALLDEGQPIAPVGAPADAARPVEVWLTATSLVNTAGQVYAIVTTERMLGSREG